MAAWTRQVGCWPAGVGYSICQPLLARQLLLVHVIQTLLRHRPFPIYLLGGDIWINSEVEQNGQTKKKKKKYIYVKVVLKS